MYETGQPHPATPLRSPTERESEDQIRTLDASIVRVFHILSIVLTVLVVGLVIVTMIALI
jgi:hypothetical protein